MNTLAALRALAAVNMVHRDAVEAGREIPDDERRALLYALESELGVPSGRYAPIRLIAGRDVSASASSPYRLGAPTTHAKDASWFPRYNATRFQASLSSYNEALRVFYPSTDIQEVARTLSPALAIHARRGAYYFGRPVDDQ